MSYRLRDEHGQWADSASWEASQNPGLALTGDGEPRLSLNVNEDLILATRRVLWLDKHALLPVLLE